MGWELTLSGDDALAPEAQEELLLISTRTVNSIADITPVSGSFESADMSRRYNKGPAPISDAGDVGNQTDVLAQG